MTINTITPPPEVEFEFQKLKHEIELDGEKYEFSISTYRGTNADGTAKWKKVNSGEDWQAIAMEAAKIFQASAGCSFEDASIVLAGDFQNITLNEFRETPVTVKTATVRYKESEDDEEWKEKTLNSQVQSVAFKELNTIIPQAFSSIQAKPVPIVNRARNIPIKTIDAHGRCLDMSIAYQIMRKKYPNYSHEDIMGHEHYGELEAVADMLRVRAAKLIRNKAIANDEDFFHQLHFSISAIPAFAAPTDKQYSDAEKFQSIQQVKQQLQVDADNKFNALQAALNRAKNQESAHIAPADKKLLQEFYANYIVERVPNGYANQGKYFNYLDSAFLHVLTNDTQNLLNGMSIKCAIIANGVLHDKKEKSGSGLTELNVNDWIFLNYSGNNHYDAVDTFSSAAMSKIATLIQIDHQKELTSFLQVLHRQGAHATAPATIKAKLHDELKPRYPKAYRALALLVWERDHHAWENNQSANRPDEPGKTPNSPDCDKEGYGDTVLKNKSAEDVKAILLAVTSDQNRRLLDTINRL